MNYTFIKATAILFSRIVLTQLDNEQRSAFRKAEKLTKQYTKIKSDLKYKKRTYLRLCPEKRKKDLVHKGLKLS